MKIPDFGDFHHKKAESRENSKKSMHFAMSALRGPQKAWKLHVILLIFKKGSAFEVNNYRGVHLTCVLFKVAERVIGARLVSFLQKRSFGVNQWAFTKGLGSKDLVTMLVMSWILGICTGKKVGAYLSDISGAFDRVCKKYILAKLYAAGIGATYLNCLLYTSPSPRD